MSGIVQEDVVAVPIIDLDLFNSLHGMSYAVRCNIETDYDIDVLRRIFRTEPINKDYYGSITIGG